ncbi:hypothetical protein ACFC34_36000 [Streptomyces sp. NPDC056053]|uniref:hypothetical protein n=1 Tax=Streptomyces sp. NPDC056053 TaxID=3345696 RepID=UPI0035DF909B
MAGAVHRAAQRTRRCLRRHAERRAARISTDEHGALSRTTLLGEVTETISDELVLVPVPDPVPHYNRGRARLQPSTT